MNYFMLLSIILLFSISNEVLSKEYKENINKNYSILLDIPENYSVKADPLFDDYHATYQITPDSEDKGVFLVMVKMIDVPRNNKELKKIVIREGERMAKQAVEGKYKINELKNKNKLIGYYLSAMTDPQAVEEQPRKIIVGQVLMKKSLIIFTYLFNDEKPENIEEVLNIARLMKINYTP